MALRNLVTSASFSWSGIMTDREKRREAERALHSLEIQIEQYRVHLDELTGQPYEEEKARAVLEKMASKLAWQRKYCVLLQDA